MIPKISRLLVLLILAATALSSPTESKAQEGGEVFSFYFPVVGQGWNTSWIGPYGGRIAAMASDPERPNVFYAGTFGAGVFKSTDSGETWSSMNAGLPGLYINALAVDPTDPDVLYAGPYEQKLFKSMDGGKSWFSASEGIQDKAIVYSIAIDPRNPANVYISTRGIPTNGWAPWKGVVYKSRDGGASWSTSLDEIGGSDQEDWVYSLAINPGSPNVIFAASHQHGPYRSTNYGDSWESVGSGVGDGSGREIAIEPGTSNPAVYLGVWHGDAIYKSTNGGGRWEASNRGILGAKIFRMVIDPLHTSTVYAASVNFWGILKTEDGGRSWGKTGLQDKDTYVIAINRSNPDIVVTGTLTDGIWKTRDAGGSWYHSQSGVRNTSVTSVLAFPGNAALLASTDDGYGISLSTDQGKSWTELNTGLGDRAVSGLVMNPANPNHVYALTPEAGLYQMDLGLKTSWARMPSLLLNPRQAAAPPPGDAAEEMPAGEPAIPGDPGTLLEPAQADELAGVPLAMAFSPADPNVAYVGTAGNGIFRSTDNGKTWQTAGLGGKTVGSLALHPADANALYAASAPGAVLYSADGGASWVDTGLGGLTVNSLCINPASPDILYAGTNAGVYSRTASRDWTLVGIPDRIVTVLSAPAATPGRVYAGTTTGLVYSDDGGATWLPGPWNLNGLSVRSVMVDPNAPHSVYAGTTTQGALKAEFP